MKYTLVIEPAILPKERHKIEDVLKKLGYNVSGGGTDTDMSACDISFSGGKEHAQFLEKAPVDTSAGRVEDA